MGEHSIMEHWDGIAAGVAAIMAAISWIIMQLKSVSEWLDKKGWTTTRHRLNQIHHQLTCENTGSLRQAINETQKAVSQLGAARRANLNSSETAMVETNKNGQLVWANEAYIALTGRSLNALRGSGWVNVIAPEERAYAETQWEHVVEERRTLDSTHTYISPEGNKFKVRVLATPLICDETGQYFGYQAKIRPATSIMEEALRIIEERATELGDDIS